MHVVLIEPQIPQNTGNIARLCAAAKATLHLVKPLGFFLDNYHVRRAGLDYWDQVTIRLHDSLPSFLAEVSEERYFLVSTKGKLSYTQIGYREDDYLLFGSETAGLPQEFLNSQANRSIRIPMWNDARSLNLSNAVAIVLYEALRQVRQF